MNHHQHISVKMNECGFTLIEVILTIVVLSVGVAGILSVMLQTTTWSGDPMQRQQAINIAESYMEEILSRPFYDDDLQPIAPPAVPCTQMEVGRANFDDICDYNGLNDANPMDINGTAILDESNNILPYQVQVAVTSADLGLPQLDASDNQAMQITVTVTPPGSPPVAITAYRTAHY